MKIHAAPSAFERSPLKRSTLSCMQRKPQACMSITWTISGCVWGKIHQNLYVERICAHSPPLERSGATHPAQCSGQSVAPSWSCSQLCPAHQASSCDPTNHNAGRERLQTPILAPMCLQHAVNLEGHLTRSGQPGTLSGILTTLMCAQRLLRLEQARASADRHNHTFLPSATIARLSCPGLYFLR